MASNDILDCWEDFTEYEAPKSGISKKPKGRTDNSAEVGPGVVITEETHRTQYKPQIRILKREPQEAKRNGNAESIGSSDGTAVEGLNGDLKPKAKTLAQREAEYAEARRRILGPTYNPEEQPIPTSVPPPPLVPPFPPPPPSIADLVPPYPPPPIHPHLSHAPPPSHTQTPPPHTQPPPQTQPPPPSYDDASPRRLAQRMENLKMNATPGVMVVRQPNGPDPNGFRGFSGFKAQDMRR